MKTGMEVIMVGEPGKPVTREYKQIIEKFSTLGKEIKISPKANLCINQPGYRSEYFVETVSVTIGIGTDHTADLVMSKTAYEALINGAKIDITTNKKFKKEFL